MPVEPIFSKSPNVTLTSELSITCDLCGVLADTHPIRMGESCFCCMGCQTVYQILSSKNELANPEQHPLFQQALKSGLISNPALLETLRTKPFEGETHKIHLEIEDMWCPSCAEVIRLILLQEKGIKNCIVDYATDLASIEFSPRHLSKETVFELIRKIGYAPRSLDDGGAKRISFDLWFRFGVGAFFSLNIMMYSYPLYASYFHTIYQFSPLFSWLSAAASLPVLFYSGWPILKRFWTSLQVGRIGMEALVVMGVFSAFGLSCYNLWHGDHHVYFDSMTAIIVLVLLGKIIESKAKFSAKETVFRLNRSMPRRCRKQFSDLSEKFVLIKEIAVGDHCVVCCGEKVPLDGIVIAGKGCCDESLMTGESIPVSKTVQSHVLAGSILTQGRLVIQVTSTLEGTALSHILNMLECDLDKKATYNRAADSIVRWFVPLVILIACIVGLTQSWISAVAVLLISCPCAIGIAAPLAEAHLMHALASIGVIVRNRGCLSLLGRETVFVFDKTGTITQGQFQVLSGLDTLTTKEKAILKALTSSSNHPISVAICRSLSESPQKLDRIEEYIGQGMIGWIGEECYRLGSKTFASGTEESNETTVFFNGHPIVLGDQVKPDAPSVISQLKVKTLLLSGDGEKNVSKVAQYCGFDSWKSQCNPLEKRELIEQLDGIVCMLGDGINDAPALTVADIGISVVSASDISIQVSDILLTTDKLDVILKMRLLARKGQRILKQNLFWAFFYNVVGIILASFGFLSPLFAAFAMVASSLIVLFNAKRQRISMVS